jgi:Ni/Co efflux regulator RcnB
VRTDQNDRQRGDRPGVRNDRYDRNSRNDRYGRPDSRYQAGRGAGPGHNFYRGDRLPWEYRQRTYVVEDWRGHHLSAPPRGYHWVQAGGDYVLVAIATGVILQLLLMGN